MEPALELTPDHEADSLLAMSLEGLTGPTIGLLAGMGVKATAPFLEMVIEECQQQYGASHPADYPHMIIFSWPIPFHPDVPVDRQALAARITEGVRRISSTGVDFIAIPANMPHLFWASFASTATVPILNMIDIVTARFQKTEGAVALLATRPLRDSGLYHRPLQRLGIEVIATDATQERIDTLIAAIWRGDPSKQLREQWLEIVSLAAAEGASSALLACTDFNAIPQWQDASLPILDATRVLAEEVVREWVRRLPAS